MLQRRLGARSQVRPPLHSNGGEVVQTGPNLGEDERRGVVDTGLGTGVAGGLEGTCSKTRELVPDEGGGSRLKRRLRQ